MSHPQTNASPGTLGQQLRSALRYWEPRRVMYNLILVGVVVVWLAVTRPPLGSADILPSLKALLLGALLANACYSTAYIADIAGQRSPFRESWQHSRWALWLLGAFVAVGLAYRQLALG